MELFYVCVCFFLRQMKKTNGGKRKKNCKLYINRVSK